MKKISYRLLLLGVCTLFSFLPSYGQTFGLEQNFPNPVPLPNSIYKILLKNKDVKETVKEERNAGKSIKAIKEKFFDVTKVNINDDKFSDLLVKAKSFLSGMNTTRYWIFKKTLKGYELIFETSTFSLRILKSKSRGHRIIETARPSGAKAYITYFRFDGRKYIYSWDKEENI